MKYAMISPIRIDTQNYDKNTIGSQSVCIDILFPTRMVT